MNWFAERWAKINIYKRSWHLFVQSNKFICYQSNEWNLLKVNNKGTTMTPLTSFSFFTNNFEQMSSNFELNSGIFIGDFEQLNTDWVLFYFTAFQYFRTIAMEYWKTLNLVGIFLFKVNIGNIRTICKICSKLTIKIPEQRY